jgi:hypothetical protein
MTESDFIKQLHKDITTHNILYSNPKKFIKYKNIKQIKLNNQQNLIKELDLPIESFLGSIYLIKDTNILGMYYWCDNKYSSFLQINEFSPQWLCKIKIYNKAIGDPETLEYYLNGLDGSCSSDTAQYLMLQLVRSGFNMYIGNI